MRMCGSGSGSAWNQQYSSSGAERGSVGVVVVHGQPVIRASLSRLALTQTQQERLARTPASLSLCLSLLSLPPSSLALALALSFSLSLSSPSVRRPRLWLCAGGYCWQCPSGWEATECE